jgi:NNP family nitrate/nitrite transporter-like MFS transporter
VGSVARPFGGWLADRLGGTRVTFWNFALMTAAALGVSHAIEAHNLSMFLFMFLSLFVTTASVTARHSG